MAKSVSSSDLGAKRFAATGLTLFLVLCVVLALALFVRAFDRTVPLTVYSDRAGLVMDRDAKVRSRGVEIGRVAKISEEFGGAKIDLEVDPKALQAIPSNSTVLIGSNTIFGAKSVDFEPPSTTPAAPMEKGSTIRSASVTTEVNSLFEGLTELLQATEPEKLNSTLGALATALDGRGEQLGITLSNLDDYLRSINPVLETFKRDLNKGSRAANLYADVSPDIMRILDSGTDVGNNLLTNQAQFEATLASAIGTGESGKNLLNENGNSIIKSMRDLRATTSLVAEYVPSLSCMIIGLNQGIEANGRVFGGSNQPGLVMRAGFQQGARPYEYPKDLPKVNASTGPHCYGLPYPDQNVNTPFAVTDTGSNVVEGMPNVFGNNKDQVFGPLPPAEPGKPAPPTLLQLMLGVAPQGGGR